MALAASLLALPPAAVAGAGMGSAPGVTSGPVTPPSPVPVPTPASLSALQAAVTAATRAATAATTAVNQAAAGEAVLREAVCGAQSALAQAGAALDRQLRRIYEDGPPPGWEQVLAGVTAADLAAGEIGVTRTASVKAAQLAAIRNAGSRLAALQRAQQRARTAVLRRAAAAVTAQTRAAELLTIAQSRYQASQAVVAEVAAQRAQLAALAQQVSLDAVAAAGPLAAAAASDQASLVARLQATPDGALPSGYQPTAEVLTGVASWYGPGFIGNLTSSGAPYDPLAYTAAMLAVPLGSVVHVVGPSGASVNLLVNDHGPYVAGRIIDLSEAAARALGIGLAAVTVTVLAPGG